MMTMKYRNLLEGLGFVADYDILPGTLVMVKKTKGCIESEASASPGELRERREYARAVMAKAMEGETLTLSCEYCGKFDWCSDECQSCGAPK